MTAVKGHGLQREGKPYCLVTCPDCAPFLPAAPIPAPPYTLDVLYPQSGVREGHALCRCGWVSSHGDTDRGRQAKHRVHKQDVA